MTVDLRGGGARILPVPGRSFDPTRIPAAIRDAGFSPGEIEVTAAGTLLREGDALRLGLPGPPGKLALAGGARYQELKAEAALVGQRIRITGKLGPSTRDGPARLTVERWESAGTHKE